MKKLHLIANAHIDPIWQWDWQEGAAATISTFQSAVNLLKEYDYVFCHNEVMVYEYVEEYAPELFKTIQELVRQGRWHIMGGWYLQPDCNMPSGESLVRQAMVGKTYFKEKFGIEPTTATNFDPFGHSRGLVQLLRKCGYDSYLIGRPFEAQCPLDDELFTWKGFDDSQVKVARSWPYRTPLGKAAKYICDNIKHNESRDTWFALWGVGNHGGGPSRQDLQAIENMQKMADFEILHSTPEAFFAEVIPSVTVEKSLQHCMPGCYTSMARLKQKHIQLENQLYMTEKICSIAAINGMMQYPERELQEAERALLNSEFHDVLPGTVIKNGEENGIRFLQHGLLLCEKAFAKAFFAFAQLEPIAKSGEYPIVVFNPNPYPIKAIIDCEFTLADQNFEEETSFITVYDGEQKLPTQTIRERSMLNCDWRKRVLFEGELPPMTVHRFSAYAEFIRQEERQAKNGGITVKSGNKSVTIDDEGYLTSYKVNEKEYIQGKAFAPYLYDDNVDPWAMDTEQLAGVGKNPMPVLPTSKKMSIFKNSSGVKVIEDGEICTVVQACFAAEHVKLRLVYTIYKTNLDVDVKATVYFNEADKFLKLHIPTPLSEGIFKGQTVFGTEELYQDGREVVAQRFVGIKENGNDSYLSLMNNCLYGHSFENGELRVSLVRGAGYCVHPMDDKPFISDTEYVDRLDQGETEFEFRLSIAKENELETKAMIFNQKPYALNMFPTSKGRVDGKVLVQLDNQNIALTAFKKKNKEDSYILRLFNNSSTGQEGQITLGNAEKKLSFGAYEVKTLVYNQQSISESFEMLI